MRDLFDLTKLTNKELLSFLEEELNLSLDKKEKEILSIELIHDNLYRHL